MSYFKWTIPLLLLCTVPALPVHASSKFEIPAFVTDPAARTSMTYNDVIAFLNAIENGELEENCSEEDMMKVCHFLTELAELGALPSDYEEGGTLCDDIEELWQQDEDRTSQPE